MAPTEVLTGCEEKWLTQKPLFLGKGVQLQWHFEI